MACFAFLARAQNANSRYDDHFVRGSRKIEKALDQLRCYHITSAISKNAVELMRKYSKSHGLAIPDALIAATALIEELPLFTLNVKDFRYIDTLSLAD